MSSGILHIDVHTLTYTHTHTLTTPLLVLHPEADQLQVVLLDGRAQHFGGQRRDHTSRHVPALFRVRLAEHLGYDCRRHQERREGEKRNGEALLLLDWLRLCSLISFSLVTHLSLLRLL